MLAVALTVLAVPSPTPDKPTPTIRVRLHEGAPSLVIQGFDLAISAGAKTLVHADRLSRWEVRCESGRVRAIPTTWNTPPTQSAAVPKPMAIQGAVEWSSHAGFLKLNDRPYRELIRVRPVGARCEVVNEVDVEKYLDGLVNSEFSATWNEESIAAQVVAARSYAWYQMREARKWPASRFDVDATVKDQVYDGSIKEDYRASQSVNRTRGQVLTLGSERNPSPFKAFYHSTCGGQTDTPERVWGKTMPGLKTGVTCPYCTSSPRYAWTTELAREELEAKLRDGPKLSGAPRVWPKNWRTVLTGKLTGLEALHPPGRLRPDVVQTTWTPPHGKPTVLELRGALFRDWIGPARLKSMAFELSGGPERFTLQGHGNGHGVGMCQWGAKVQGEQGKKWLEILAFYYPGVAVRKLW